jgi:hypothetical protein
MIALEKPLDKSKWRNEPDDIRQVAIALSDTGHYQLPPGGKNPLFWMPEDKLFESVQNFQREQGLKVDGVVAPGGPTERRLNTVLGADGEQQPADATAKQQVELGQVPRGGAVSAVQGTPFLQQDLARRSVDGGVDGLRGVPEGEPILVADARSDAMNDAGAEAVSTLAFSADFKKSYPAISPEKAAAWSTCTWPSGKGADKPGVNRRPCTTSLPGKGTPEERVWQMRNELDKAQATGGHIESASDPGSKECVVLVKHFHPELGPASGWRQGQSIGALTDISPGDAFASGFVNGRYTNKSTGNHAIIIYDVHYDENGKPVSVDYADQYAQRDISPTRKETRKAKPVRIRNISVNSLISKGYYTIHAR